MARCLPMELAATNGKRLFVEGEGSVESVIAGRTVGAPPQFGVSSVTGARRGVVSVSTPGGSTRTTPSNPHSFHVPITAGGDECDATMDVAMIAPAPFAAPSQASVAPMASCATQQRRGTKRRRDVATEATAAGNLQRLVVARRSIALSAVPRPRGVATVVASAGDSVSPSTRVAADSVLTARPRLTPILKSHSACKATGRGSVPVVRRSTVKAKTSRVVHAACSTPGGNTPSPRVIGTSLPVVRFAESCKDHDGPRLLNSVFDQLVTKFFENKVKECHQLLVRHGTADPAMPRKLVTMCHNLAERIVAAKSGNAAVLPHGGGSVSRLGREHLMSLLVLQGMITEAACAAETPATPLATSPAAGWTPATPLATSPAAGSDQARVSSRSLVTASFADDVARVEDDDDFLLTMDYLSMDDMPAAAAGTASATLTPDWKAMLEECDSDESGSVSQIVARAYDGIVAGC